MMPRLKNVRLEFEAGRTFGVRVDQQMHDDDNEDGSPIVQASLGRQQDGHLRFQPPIVQASLGRQQDLNYEDVSPNSVAYNQGSNAFGPRWPRWRRPLEQQNSTASSVPGIPGTRTPSMLEPDDGVSFTAGLGEGASAAL